MISNTSSTHGTPPPNLPPERPRKIAAAGSVGSEILSTASLERLREALSSTPEIRPEVVAHGEHLATDVDYPPRMIIEDIARQIVDSEDLSVED